MHTTNRVFKDVVFNRVMNVRNLILGIGIVLVYALLLWQGFSTFYPRPDFESYCGEKEFRVPRSLGEPFDCQTPLEVTTAINLCYEVDNYFHSDYDENGCVIGGFCDDCNKQYESSRQSHGMIEFVAMLILGIITFTVGYFILSIEPVGNSLIAASIWTVFFGTVSNIEYIGKFFLFFMLLAVFVALIWLAMRFNRKISEKRPNKSPSKSKTMDKKRNSKKKKGFWKKAFGK